MGIKRSQYGNKTFPVWECVWVLLSRVHVPTTSKLKLVIGSAASLVEETKKNLPIFIDIGIFLFF